MVIAYNHRHHTTCEAERHHVRDQWSPWMPNLFDPWKLKRHPRPVQKKMLVFPGESSF